jgi:hypothetical protein
MLMLRYSDGVGQLYRRSSTYDQALMFRCLTLLRRFFDGAVCMCPYAARQVPCAAERVHGRFRQLRLLSCEPLAMLFRR